MGRPQRRCLWTFSCSVSRAEWIPLCGECQRRQFYGSLHFLRSIQRYRLRHCGTWKHNAFAAHKQYCDRVARRFNLAYAVPTGLLDFTPKCGRLTHQWPALDDHRNFARYFRACHRNDLDSARKSSCRSAALYQCVGFHRFSSGIPDGLPGDFCGSRNNDFHLPIAGHDGSIVQQRG